MHVSICNIYSRYAFPLEFGGKDIYYLVDILMDFISIRLICFTTDQEEIRSGPH